MSEDNPTVEPIGDEDLSSAVVLAITAAAQRMEAEPNEAIIATIGEAWPPLLDDNAFIVATTVALAVANMAGLTPDDLIAAATAAME